MIPTFKWSFVLAEFAVYLPSCSYLLLQLLLLLLLQFLPIVYATMG